MTGVCGEAAEDTCDPPIVLNPCEDDLDWSCATTRIVSTPPTTTTTTIPEEPTPTTVPEEPTPTTVPEEPTTTTIPANPVPTAPVSPTPTAPASPVPTPEDPAGIPPERITSGNAVNETDWNLIRVGALVIISGAIVLVTNQRKRRTAGQ